MIEAFPWCTGIQNWWVIIWTQIPQQTYSIENHWDYSIIIIEIKRKWDYLNFSSFFKARMVGRRRLQLEHRPCYLQVSRKSSKWSSIIYILGKMRFRNGRLRVNRCAENREWGGFSTFSRWRSRVFLNRTSLTPLRFWMRISWKITI